jgi:hypothetical protein
MAAPAVPTGSRKKQGFPLSFSIYSFHAHGWPVGTINITDGCHQKGASNYVFTFKKCDALMRRV